MVGVTDLEQSVTRMEEELVACGTAAAYGTVSGESSINLNLRRPALDLGSVDDWAFDQ